MEIHIESIRSGESNYEATKILFRLFSRKYFLTLGITLVAAVLCLSAGLPTGHETVSSTSTYHEESRTYVTYTTKYNFQVTFGLGIAFSLLFLRQLIGLLRLRSSFFLEARTRRNRRTNAGNNKFTVKITDQDVHYQDIELDQLTKWSIYVNYLFQGSYLLLFTSASILIAVAIDLSGVSPGDVNELRAFLKGKLPERKILKLF